MTLQELNNQIHAIRNQADMASKLNTLKSQIKTALLAGQSALYYMNHTGRELYRKLSNFGMESEILAIGDDHDAGFRPLTVNGICDSAFSPISLGSLEAWYDASDSSTITKNGSDHITLWSDKSGKNNHLAGTSKAGSDPITGIVKLNSLDVIDFDGGDFFKLNTLSTPTSGNLQAFIVCKVTEVSNNADSIISMDAANNDWQIGAGNASQYRGILTFSDQTPHGSTTSGSNSGITGFHIFCADLDFDNDGKYQLLVDGETLAGTSVRDYSAKLASTVEFYIFANRQENQFPKGSVAEVILLDNTDNLTRQKVEGYLAHKWGIQNLLAGSHPYKTKAP